MEKIDPHSNMHQILEKKLKQISTSIIELTKLHKIPTTPLLIAVSKKQSLEKILFFTQLGLFDFGENYVQEWKHKKEEIEKLNPEISKKIRWHFIGHLQSNKVKDVVGNVEYIHTIDSLKIAKKVSQIAKKLNIQQKILLEINLANESNKAGFELENFKKQVPEISKLPNLLICGLMAIPPQTDHKDELHSYFKQLKTLLDEWSHSGLFNPKEFKELSMGMSQDYPIAISEGSSMIRIGTALFGPRSD